MLHMRSHGTTERIFRTFHKVTSASAVNMDFHSARNDIHSLGVNQVCTNYGKVTVSHFQNLVITNQNRTIFHPALWCQDTTVNNLS